MTNDRRFQGLRALSTFAGLGGTLHALRGLGFDGQALEYWAPAVASLKANGFRHVHHKDVKKFDWSSAGEVDLLTGGPPCQPWSQGGVQAGEDDPRDCIPDFIDGVAALRPALFIMENVVGLTFQKNRPYLDDKIARLEALGYTVAWKILDASLHSGVAQKRRRLFVVGRLEGDVVWPEEEQSVSMAEYLDWDQEIVRERALAAPNPDVDKAQWVFDRPATTVVGSFRPDVQAAPGYRLAGDGPRQNTAGSVVTTFEERLTLQGLPAGWKVEGTKAQRDLQVGNSCPPALIAAVVSANRTAF